MVYFKRAEFWHRTGFRIVVALTSAGSPSNPRVRSDPIIDPPQADIELDVLFAPYVLTETGAQPVLDARFTSN